MKQKLPILKASIFYLFSFFFLVKLPAQSLQLNGKIIDSTSQQPVAGATITAGKQTVTSDAEGNFTVNANKGANVTISYVGYASRTVIADGDFLSIQIAPSAQQLSDVVVTALGIKKETKKIGYAVQQVEGEDLVKARDQNPVTGLVGKVAGLSVGPSAELLRKPR